MAGVPLFVLCHVGKIPGYDATSSESHSRTHHDHPSSLLSDSRSDSFVLFAVLTAGCLQVPSRRMQNAWTSEWNENCLIFLTSKDWQETWRFWSKMWYPQLKNKTSNQNVTQIGNYNLFDSLLQTFLYFRLNHHLWFDWTQSFPFNDTSFMNWRKNHFDKIFTAVQWQSTHGQLVN